MPETAAPAAGMLALREVGHAFGGFTVLRSVSFDVPQGQIVGLIGPNGSGKTTLFNIVTGYIAPLRGRVLYRGAALGRQSVQERSRRGLVRTFQTPQVFEQMTVLENVMVGCCKHHRTGMVQDFLRLPGARRRLAEIAAHAEATCARFGLDGQRHVLARNLTAGQRRILEIARAVAGAPALLLLDEPSSGLNPEEIDHLRGWIERLCGEGMTVLLVSHDMELVAVAGTVHVLNFGEIVASGPMAEIQRDRQVREVYLGA
jgi:ABC-type branched-subunit amino acid transport system ATPase component